MPLFLNQFLVMFLLLPLVAALIVLSFLFPKVFLSEEMVTFLFMLTTITIGIVIARPGLLTPIRKKGASKGPSVVVLPGPQIVRLRGKPQPGAPDYRRESVFTSPEAVASHPAVARVQALQAKASAGTTKTTTSIKARRPKSLAEQAAEQSPNMTLIWGLVTLIPAFFFMSFIFSQLPTNQGELPMSFYGVAILGSILLGVAWAAVVPSPKQRKITRMLKQRARQQKALAKQLALEKELAEKAAIAQSKLLAARAQQQAAQLALEKVQAQAAGLTDSTTLSDAEVGQEMIDFGTGETLEEIKNRLKPKKPKIPMEMLSSANSYDDKVALIRFLVSEDSGRVMKAFQQMVKPAN